MFQPDLTNCDREPIHIPGRVQSHGFIVVTGEDDQITHVSSNIADFTGTDIETKLWLNGWSSSRLLHPFRKIKQR